MRLNRLWQGRTTRPQALLALAAFLPLVAYAAFNGYISLEGRQASLDAQAVSSAHALGEDVDRAILSGLDEAQTLADAPALDPASQRMDSFEELARRTRRRHPEWGAVILLDPAGRWLFNTESDAHRMAVDMPSLREAVATGRPVVGDIVANGEGQWGVPLRAPVVQQGRVIYVVTVVLRPNALRGLITTMRAPASWIVAVVNGHGHVVARSADDTQLLGKPMNAEALAARARGGGGTYRGRTLGGLDTQSAYWMSPATGWSVHIAILRTVYQAPVRQMVVTLLVGFAVSLLLAAALVVLWIRDQEARRGHGAAVEQATRIDALGRLTGGVAHDFNNLLTVIQGNAEMLSRRLTDTTPQAAKSLSAIRVATDRAAKLTRQLLVFARGGPADPITVDLAAKVDELLGPMAQLVGAGVTIETSLDPGLPPVSVDPLQLEAALLNLAANARDAMDGAGRLEISLRRSGAWVALSVRDGGAGFDPAFLSRVFDPFFTTKPVGQGTGLGLSQVYGLMKGVEGRVEASNAPGGGGVVTLMFPPSSQPLAHQDEAAADAAPSGGGPIRVLLVDDNEAVRITTAAYLRECGLVVMEAAEAARALELLEAGPIDAVVSDIIMPGEMDGIALAQTVRARWPRLPVILVSGYSERAAEAGARGFTVLLKPYSLPELESRLRTLVDGVAFAGG